MATKEPAEVVGYWQTEIQQARKREQRYRTSGRKIRKIYHADDEQHVPFNILFSNTETLLPAIYSRTARPVVQRRFQDADPIGKLAAEAGRRALEYFLDTNRADYDPPHDAFEQVVLDALTPGRGMMTVKYDAEFRPIAEPQPPDEDTDPVQEAPAEEAYHEAVCVETLAWDRVYLGYAKHWSKVPWIAYEYFLTKEEVVVLFGGDKEAKTLATKLKYTAAQTSDDQEADDRDDREDRDKTGQRRVACLYQIWDKAGGRKIKYYAPSYKDGLLKEEDDPLELTGFYNTPRPLTFVRKTATLLPTAPYQYYTVQAEELNELTRRINRITKAVKARALYDAQFGEVLERLMQKDDAMMIPIQTAASLAADRGVEQAVWFFPVEVIVATLQQLYQAREACKQVIYEITGISDILRGATQASETATAQKIKNSWGTLRLKRVQADVARYVRDILRMALELMATKFSEETWAAMTGLPFLVQAEQQRLQMQAQAIAAMGQPVPEPLQAKLAMPTWQDILAVLRDDFARAYRIDIETNSTVEPEAAEDQEAIMKLLGAVGQALNGIAPLVANGSMPFEVAKNILLVVARRFRYGDQLEDAINAMKPPQPPDTGAKEAEAAKKELELQKKQASAELQHQQKSQEMDLEEQKMRAEMDAMKREMDLMKREMQLQLEQDKHSMQQDIEQQRLSLTKQRADEEIGVKSKLLDMENKKYKTENVVNQKADTALNKGVQAMQGMIQQLAQMVAQQSQENQRMIQEMVSAINRPRTKRAIRGKDGRIEAVAEEVAPV